MAAAVATPLGSHFSSDATGTSYSSLADSSSNDTYKPFSTISKFKQLSPIQQSHLIRSLLKSLEDEWIRTRNNQSDSNGRTSDSSQQDFRSLASDESRSDDDQSITDSSSNPSTSVASVSISDSSPHSSDLISAEVASKSAKDTLEAESIRLYKENVHKQQQTTSMTDTGTHRPGHHLSWQTKSALTTPGTSRVGPKKTVTWGDLPVPDICTDKTAGSEEREKARKEYRKREGWTKASMAERLGRISSGIRPDDLLGSKDCIIPVAKETLDEEFSLYLSSYRPTEAELSQDSDEMSPKVLKWCQQKSKFEEEAIAVDTLKTDFPLLHKYHSMWNLEKAVKDGEEDETALEDWTNQRYMLGRHGPRKVYTTTHSERDDWKKSIDLKSTQRPERLEERTKSAAKKLQEKSFCTSRPFKRLKDVFEHTASDTAYSWVKGVEEKKKKLYQAYLDSKRTAQDLQSFRSQMGNLTEVCPLTTTDTMEKYFKRVDSNRDRHLAEDTLSEKDYTDYALEFEKLTQSGVTGSVGPSVEGETDPFAERKMFKKWQQDQRTEGRRHRRRWGNPK